MLLGICIKGIYLSVNIDRTTAYSMMALKMLKMQVTMNLSIALSLLEAAAGALALKIHRKLFRFT